MTLFRNELLSCTGVHRYRECNCFDSGGLRVHSCVLMLNNSFLNSMSAARMSLYTTVTDRRTHTMSTRTSASAGARLMSLYTTVTDRRTHTMTHVTLYQVGPGMAWQRQSLPPPLPISHPHHLPASSSDLGLSSLCLLLSWSLTTGLWRTIWWLETHHVGSRVSRVGVLGLWKERVSPWWSTPFLFVSLCSEC